MKLTLTIDDAHAPLLIQLLATLLAKSSPVEATTDPAPGHPELPLMPATAPEPVAVQCGKTQTVEEWAEANAAPPPPAAVLPDPFDIKIMPEPLDFTRRELPLPEEFINIQAPPIPCGKSGWIYRGTFSNQDYPAPDRIVMFYDPNDGQWRKTSRFSCDFHHIEAV